MAFHDREYEVYVVLGGPTAPRPWLQSAWGKITAALDPLMDAARDRPAVRSTQLGPKPGSPNQRSLSFGRIGWNDQGAKKWAHSVDGQLVSGDQAHFLTSEVWAPSWTACERDLMAPDVYLAISNAADFGAPSKPDSAAKFSSTCLLAFASDLNQQHAGQARKGAETIATVLQAVVRGHCVRPWGRSTGSGSSYTDAINDLAIVGLFNPGPRHIEPASLSMLKGTWAPF